MTAAETPITYMYAEGPLVTAAGALVCEANAVPAPPPRPVVVRCLDAAGRDVADPVVLTGPLGREALALIVGQREAGDADAERFWRCADAYYTRYQEFTGRGAGIARRLLQLERLALAAVKREIPARVTWG